jgi:hypothetical protein
LPIARSGIDTQTIFEVFSMVLETANCEADLIDGKAAPLFDLLERPFYVLGIDPTASDLEVNGAGGVARYGALDSELRLSCAREAVLALDKRLLSELSYPLDSRPEEIAALYDALLGNASVAECLSIADRLAPLSRANFCAHLAARQPANGTLLYTMVASHGAIDSTEIYELLKTFRSTAKRPIPSLLNVVHGLRELLDLHAAAAISEYDNVDDASEPVLACTQAVLASGERYQIEALEGFLRTYRKAIKVKRSRAATLVEKASDALRQQPEDMRLVAVFSDALRFWCLLCRPLIAFNAHQNCEGDETLEGPPNCVLRLIDDLTGRHHYTVARQIAELGRAELDLAGEPFQILRARLGLLSSAEAVRRLRELINELDGAPSLIGSLERNGFGPRTEQPVGGLWEAFSKAALLAGQTDFSEPWSLLRDLAMRLSQSQHHLAASALLRGMIQHGHGVGAPSGILATLPYDLVLIEGQRRLRPEESQTAVPVENAPRPPLEPEAVGRRPGSLQGLLKGLRLAAAALVGAAAYFGFGQVPALRWQQLPATLLSTGASGPDEEAMPPVGTGQRYGLPYVRYCQFQQERLKIIKELAKGPEDVRAYNLLVVDFNARCSDFLYQTQDLMTVAAEVAANQLRLEADAKRIVSSWPGHDGTR